MKTDITVTKEQTVSSIFETQDPDGSGTLGFTINKADGSFKNIMRSYSAQDHDLVLAELKKERTTILNTRKKH